MVAGGARRHRSGQPYHHPRPRSAGRFHGVSEILVTARDVPAPQSIDELSGEEIFVRPSSSYYEHLEALNLALAQRGLAPAQLVAADEHLEDEDLLEMVNAGLVPRIVMDDYKARLWAKVFPEVRIHPELIIGTLNRTLFAFAGYNAGPTRINRLRGKAAKKGLDPDQWFKQRRAHRHPAHRARNCPVRRQHLQVLHRVQAHRGAASDACAAQEDRTVAERQWGRGAGGYAGSDRNRRCGGKLFTTRPPAALRPNWQPLRRSDT